MSYHGNILQHARSMQDELIELRRDFHRHPELSGEEHRTTETIRQFLADIDVEILASDLETGVIGRLRRGAGPTVALRADIDALPLQEDSGLPFASATPGVMHACGHDAHMTWLLGAACMLSQRDDLPGEVRLLFQPAEEITSGAEKMIAAGALDDVDMVFGAHTKPDLPCGEIGVKPGYLMASTGAFEFAIHGKGGHGAVPQTAIDPIPAAGNILTAVQSIVARDVDPLESGVITVGKLSAGTAGNIIPSTATLQGTMRAFEPEVKEMLVHRLRTVVENVARAHDCRAEVRRLAFGVPPVHNDSDAAEIARQAAAELLGDRAVLNARPVLASEDFSCYQKCVPGCFFWIGTGDTSGEEPNHGWHHPAFTIDEESLSVGTAVMTQTALNALESLS